MLRKASTAMFSGGCALLALLECGGCRGRGSTEAWVLSAAGVRGQVNEQK